ncbi:hypothetical protein ACRYJU_00490 [Alloalcanivorax xenomutans]|uniref:hypothetical protein n=1 Tax=Alloalcanivorax xenomutans TaxID=1094342 RepID=UPI003D9B04B7
MPFAFSANQVWISKTQDLTPKPYVFAHSVQYAFGAQRLLGIKRQVRAAKGQAPGARRNRAASKTVAEFLKQDVPAMKKWWSEYRRHWAERRNSEESVSFSEYTLHQLLRETDKLKPNKHLHNDHLSTPSSLQDGT